MQRGLIPFPEFESNQPLAQIQGLAQNPSRGAVTHNLLSGRDKRRDVRTTPRDVCAAPETKAKRTAQGHSRVAEQQEPEALTPLRAFCPGSPVFATVGQLQHLSHV